MLYLLLTNMHLPLKVALRCKISLKLCSNLAKPYQRDTSLPQVCDMNGVISKWKLESARGLFAAAGGEAGYCQNRVSAVIKPAPNQQGKSVPAGNMQLLSFCVIIMDLPGLCALSALTAISLASGAPLTRCRASLHKPLPLLSFRKIINFKFTETTLCAKIQQLAKICLLVCLHVLPWNKLHFISAVCLQGIATDTLDSCAV